MDSSRLCYFSFGLLWYCRAISCASCMCRFVFILFSWSSATRQNFFRFFIETASKTGTSSTLPPSVISVRRRSSITTPCPSCTSSSTTVLRPLCTSVSCARAVPRCGGTASPRCASGKSATKLRGLRIFCLQSGFALVRPAFLTSAFRS